MNIQGYNFKSLAKLQAATAAATQTYVDCSPTASAGKRECVVLISAVHDTAGTFNFNVQECATTNGTYSTVTSAAAIGAVTTDGLTIQYVSPKYRYIRSQITTVSGTAAQGDFHIAIGYLKREAA